MSPDEFTGIARKWGDFMHHVTRSALAIRMQDGTWGLQFGFIEFSPEELSASALRVETKSILAIRETSTLGDKGGESIEATLSDLASFQIGGQVLHLHSIVTPTYYPLHLPRFAGPQRCPSMMVVSQGATSQFFPELWTLDLEMKAYHMPYDGLAELLIELDCPFSARDMVASTPPRIEISLAPPARTDRAEINNSDLVVEVITSHKLDNTKLLLGVKCFPREGGDVQRISLSHKIVQQHMPSLATITFRQSLPEVGRVETFLRYDGEFLDSEWARNPLTVSVRAALHKAIDRDNALVTKFFAYGNRNRNVFEEHVLVLLSILGLDCLHYGNIPELSDGPDILALSNQNHLYVIECTTGDINNKGKLRHLYDRTKEIKSALQTSPYYPREILSVMVTSDTKAETRQWVNELASYGIAIISREEIEALLDQMEAPSAADLLFATLLATIPRQQELIQPAIDHF